ncbi:hypothetical protein L13192_05254 [Pyrenophora tritici-repentis]|uniref:Uncharacterized protein n=2 Tax=Pyrenophora tritici-repentis TaxID=45151 RepID=A0A922N6X4_9PLEO|nr:uncharacterized protein PTRG_04416 [Pyrenophora tritici-repentis Pt-1C-BFP]EDU47254.1 conserved hypothetical protein [Pyrenophora tritici-repentis Pt-1C-BFP]KAI1510743.1 hypothetical protein Ptr86124_010548 [Pyrenophora tritici-repentis]KAI1669738.1 hypothetical protein L13192_05254 [Pyrenophora tritici-repentis]KAI1681323.1 hypothetical protein KJE20_08194 [Pyrenophora tritici-repentis]
MLLPTSLLTFLHLALPALCHASPQPPLITTDWEQSLVPRHTLFLRQVSDLQTFTSALGGTKASPITNSGDAKRPFKVDGDTFTDFETAAQRSCDNQFQGCSRAANGGGGGGGKKPRAVRRQQDGGNNNNGSNNGNNNNDNKDKLTVNQCDEQKNKCNAAQKSAPVKDFNSAVASTNIGPDPDFPDFDLICEG